MGILTPNLQLQKRETSDLHQRMMPKISESKDDCQNYLKKIEKKIIKEKPRSPNKFEITVLDPNLQLKFEPEIIIKECNYCQSEDGNDEDENDALEVTGEEIETKQWKKVVVNKDLNQHKELTPSENELNKKVMDNPVFITNIDLSDDDNEEDDPELDQYLSRHNNSSLPVRDCIKPITDIENKFDSDEDEDEGFSNDVEEINDQVIEDNSSLSSIPECLSLLPYSNAEVLSEVLREETGLIIVQVCLETGDQEVDL